MVPFVLHSVHFRLASHLHIVNIKHHFIERRGGHVCTPFYVVKRWVTVRQNTTLPGEEVDMSENFFKIFLLGLLYYSYSITV